MLQQYLSIPVYTIFKNLTIILIVRFSIFLNMLRRSSLAQAYGEVLWFGGRVTGLTLVSFFFMVRTVPFIFENIVVYVTTGVLVCNCRLGRYQRRVNRGRPSCDRERRVGQRRDRRCVASQRRLLLDVG